MFLFLVTFRAFETDKEYYIKDTLNNLYWKTDPSNFTNIKTTSDIDDASGYKMIKNGKELNSYKTSFQLKNEPSPFLTSFTYKPGLFFTNSKNDENSFIFDPINEKLGLFKIKTLGKCVVKNKGRKSDKVPYMIQECNPDKKSLIFEIKPKLTEDVNNKKDDLLKKNEEKGTENPNKDNIKSASETTKTSKNLEYETNSNKSTTNDFSEPKDGKSANFMEQELKFSTSKDKKSSTKTTQDPKEGENDVGGSFKGLIKSGSAENDVSQKMKPNDETPKGDINFRMKRSLDSSYAMSEESENSKPICPLTGSRRFKEINVILNSLDLFLEDEPENNAPFSSSKTENLTSNEKQMINCKINEIINKLSQ